MGKVLIHDISYWQGNLSTYWQMFREKGCKAIICQSSNGLAYQSYYRDTAPLIQKEGFLLGSYHYYREHIQNMEGTWVICNPTRQADNYYTWVTKVGIPNVFPPVLDIELGGNPMGVSYNNINACLKHIEKLFGRTPIVYTSPNVARSFARAGMERYPLWLAHYTTEDKVSIPEPWKKWTIWQFSDKLTYDKVNSNGVVVSRKPIDHNWFNGNLGELKKWIVNTGGTLPDTTPASQPEPTPAPTPTPTPATQPVIDISDLKARIVSAVDEWAKTL